MNPNITGKNIYNLHVITTVHLSFEQSLMGILNSPLSHSDQFPSTTISPDT